MTTNSAEETYDLAYSLAAFCKASVVFLLDGALATGKTVFAKGLGAGLGVKEHIKSPTFTLFYPYEGRLPFYHFDAYRLADAAEFCDSGFDEYLNGDGVTLIEWGERVIEALAPAYIRVRLTRGQGDNVRTLTFSAIGALHHQLLEAWRTREHIGL